jgi:hypothetical protein
MTDLNFTVDIATKDDFPFILELLSTEYSFPYNTEIFWRWRYIENPAANVAIYVARAANRDIMAMQVVSAFPICIGGEKSEAFLFTAAITHPDYRRLGLFRKLVTQISSNLTKEKPEIPLIFTFPNEQSVRGFRRFNGWQQREILNLYIRPVISIGKQISINTVISNPSEQQINGDVAFSQVAQISDTKNLLSTVPFLNQNVFIERSVDYLKWRYTSNPISKYLLYEAHSNQALVGYIVVKSIQYRSLNVGLIVDLIAKDDQVAGGLIKQVIKTATSSGIKMLGYLVSEYNPYHKTLAKCGFIKVPDRILPKHFYLYTYASDGDKVQVVSSKNPWYVTWGDTDIV